VQEPTEEAVVESQLGLAGDQGGCGGSCHVRRLDTVINEPIESGKSKNSIEQ
jgi:hypothetical protein